MTKDTIEILEYDFIKGTLQIMFSLNKEEGYREIKICEGEFSDYIESIGGLSNSCNVSFKSSFFKKKS